MSTKRGMRALTVAAACATAAGLVAVADTAVAEPSGLSAFDVAGAGASVPGLTQYEAEDASTTGTVIGPDYEQGSLASEASGRRAVQLSQGQHVEFTLTAEANAVDVAYSVSQGAEGTLSLYVNGAKHGTLSLTSKYSHITTGHIPGSKTHQFFDDARLLLEQQLQSGDKVRLQVDEGDSASPYTIDLLDTYQVAGPAEQPEGSVSVVDTGGDPTGANDSSQAFRDAIARGGTVWVPPGRFRVDQPLRVEKATIVGAGRWHSEILSNKFIENGSAVPGPVNLADFAVIGSTVGRHDNSTHNAINGSLGTGSQISGLWMQNQNVAFWLMHATHDVTIKDSVMLSMSADALNLNGNATNVTVSNNYIRNTGDDSLAMWSLYSANTGNSFVGNTIVQPNLANGIAIYGGKDITVSDNVITDTNALGSGIALSNQEFVTGSGFSPLAGTMTVSGNTLIRTGAMNPNWQHPMSAIRVDSYDHPVDATVNLTGNRLVDSPWSALQVVSGGGKGHPVTNLTVDDLKVDGVGTVVLQAETPGTGKFSNVTATDVGVAGIYNCSYPEGKPDFTVEQGSGNSGWDSEWEGCEFPDQG